MFEWRRPSLWLFAGGLEMLFLVHLAEFLYPDYSVSQDYLSELGVGPAAPRLLFALALIIFGLMMLVASYLMRQKSRQSRLWLLLSISAIGAIGVGIFDMKDFRELHGLFALLAFLFGNLAAVYSWKEVRPPLSYVFVILGLVGLAALILLIAGFDLGLGLGGIERLAFYPAMFWILGYGAFLAGEQSHTAL